MIILILYSTCSSDPGLCFTRWDVVYMRVAFNRNRISGVWEA
jgi:hypothetical protein